MLAIRESRIWKAYDDEEAKINFIKELDTKEYLHSFPLVFIDIVNFQGPTQSFQKVTILIIF